MRMLRTQSRGPTTAHPAPLTTERTQDCSPPIAPAPFGTIPCLWRRFHTHPAPATSHGLRSLSGAQCRAQRRPQPAWLVATLAQAHSTQAGPSSAIAAVLAHDGARGGAPNEGAHPQTRRASAARSLVARPCSAVRTRRACGRRRIPPSRRRVARRRVARRRGSVPHASCGACEHLHGGGSEALEELLQVVRLEGLVESIPLVRHQVGEPERIMQELRLLSLLARLK